MRFATPASCETRCAQSRTRFEPPFHKIVHAFSLFRHSRLERESSSRKAGLFVTVCSRLKSLFCFTLSQVRQISRVAGRACYFVAGFSRLKSLFCFTLSQVQQISRVAGRACYFAAGFSRLKSLFCFTLSRVQQINRVAGKACYFAAGFSRLKSLFCFTLSQVWSLSRVAITGSAGFGLLEMLVGAVVGTILISGSAKFMDLTLQSVNMSKAILTENDFKATIAKGLSSDCAKSDPEIKKSKNGLDTNGKGEFTGTLPGDIKKGVFKGSIEVIKIELKGKATEPATGPLPRDFIVYYKKKNLGKLSAPDHFNCTATPTVKETGCFKHKCSVSLDRANKQCTDLISCHTIAEAVLTEWTAKVETISQEKVSEAIKNKSCTTDGEFIKDFDTTGAVDCDPPPPHPTKNCPPGEFVREIKADGTILCESACSGGMTLHETLIHHTSCNSEGYVRETYPVGNTYHLRTYERYRNECYDDIQQGFDPILISKTRFCACPRSLEAGWGWSYDQAWDHSENKCMSCDGNWIRTNGQRECDCTGGQRKKKKWLRVFLYLSVWSKIPPSYRTM